MRTQTLCAVALLAFGATTAQAQPAAAPRLPTGGAVADSDCPDLSTARASLVAQPSQVAYGQSITLRWQAQLPEECALFLGETPVEPQGSMVLAPARPTTFVLTVRSLIRKRVLATAGVAVSFPPVLVIDDKAANPAGTLIAALAAKVPDIQLCNVDIDLTGHTALALQTGQSLTAKRGCERGPRSMGPRIFVRDRNRPGTSLFIVRGNNVRIAGFRLEGPTPVIGGEGSAGVGADDFDKAFGITVISTEGAEPVAGISISNMEIYHWPGAGIEVRDVDEGENARFRQSLATAAGVLIEHNFIHHNRHFDGFGYGVTVAKGGYALVQRNVFEENRHAMAGDSANKERSDFSGFIFRENLVLPGGGVHCNTLHFPGTDSVVGKFCWRTHQIDMHGTQSSRTSAHCCGTAGETMLIERNTLLYTGGPRPLGPTTVHENGLSIKIRGNPKDRVLVDGNVFAHSNRGDAIAQNGEIQRVAGPNGPTTFVQVITRPISVTANNRFGANPMAQLGRCDFVGDGKRDAFMATGITWWARSSFSGQWRFLNVMPEGLSQVVLGDLNGDGRCDVGQAPRNPAAAVRRYSLGGKGPWVPRLVANPAQPGLAPQQ